MLEKLYSALLSVRPTSVESEHTFSTTGLFATKLRSKLSDEHLSDLVILKFHFKYLKKN